MLINGRADIRASEITSERDYMNRRRFIGGATAAAAAGIAPSLLAPRARAALELGSVTASAFSTGEERTPYEDVTSYNNFYEFGTDKRDPARNAREFKTDPWTVQVLGECENQGTFQLEDFIKPHALEERVYRLRCVEAWSMVVPWLGIPLGPVIERCKPLSSARYVAFRTLHDPQQMPGQRRPVLDWPYVEGLRMDEAMHPLTILSVGLYGQVLPNQNGAPLRLVVPWKYGFKSIKSIVAISFTTEQPPTSWNKAAPREYGFYSNVNPQVRHPRWSQKKERRIGDLLKRRTLMFNGYAEQVGKLYADMDLKRFY